MNNQNEKNTPELPEEQAEERRAKINRAIYITAVILLVAVAIIAGVVSAANRAKKDPDPTPIETPKTSETPKASTPESSPTESNSGGESSQNTPDTTVSGEIPELTLPVSGSLSVSHDPDQQVFSPTMNDYRVHLGVDINTAEGASVNAAAEGVIKKIWDDPLMGTCVAVAHDGEAITYYKNLDKTLGSGIKEGASVSSGQLIGKVGDSAMIEVAQEPHLHFEMTVKGLQVDPADYFSDSVWAELAGDSSYEG